MPYRSIDDPAKLRRLLEAALLIEADLDLPALLGHIIEEAISLTGARYGAIGVLDEARTGLDQFLTVGLDPEQERAIGARPTGKGVLGFLITDPRPVRVADIGSHPESFGFPPHHPPMTSFLGVPIKVRGEVYGNLYLTEKIGWSEFTRDDEALVESLAIGAGIAIENARLHQRVAAAAVYDDRDRVARDLHDTVIQRLFAIGLSLQSIAGGSLASDVTDRLQVAISDLDETIVAIRSTIYELASAGVDRGLRASILALVRELTPALGFEVHVSLDGPVDSALSDQIGEHLLATAREALSNVGHHARASAASLTVSVANGRCLLEVVDNGKGFDETDDSTRGGGLGLTNLRRRAAKLHGSLSVETAPSGGTILSWCVPTTS